MNKGNIVKSNQSDTEGLVLALTKDGKRVKLYVLGSDGNETWHPVIAWNVIEDGDEQCWKCLGSGIFQGGGGTLNGRFTGYTGICFACEGKGVQNNADRIRNHYYWHRHFTLYMGLSDEERDGMEMPSNRPAAWTPVNEEDN